MLYIYLGLQHKNQARSVIVLMFLGHDHFCVFLSFPPSYQCNQHKNHLYILNYKRNTYCYVAFANPADCVTP